MSANIPRPELRAVVDTNLFISGLIARTDAPPARLVDAVVAQLFTLVTSLDLDAEVAGVLARPRLTRGYAIDRDLRERELNRIAIAEHVIPAIGLPLQVRDPKDEKLLACALDGRASFLVTGDADLLELAGSPAIGALSILTARDFIEAIGLP